jgi:hypothetical protein
VNRVPGRTLDIAWELTRKGGQLVVKGRRKEKQLPDGCFHPVYALVVYNDVEGETRMLLSLYYMYL